MGYLFLKRVSVDSLGNKCYIFCHSVGTENGYYHIKVLCMFLFNTYNLSHSHPPRSIRTSFAPCSLLFYCTILPFVLFTEVDTVNAVFSLVQFDFP